MTRNEQRLLRHLIIAVLLKLIVLIVLWWTFVRDARVYIDTEMVAEKISGVVPSQGASK